MEATPLKPCGLNHCLTPTVAHKMTTTTWYMHQEVFAQRAIFNSALERTGCFATLAKGKWFVLKMVAQLIM